MNAAGAGELCVVDDPAALAEVAAKRMASAIAEALRERGVARVALSGGSTPGGAYRRLATRPLEVEQITWLWVDERCVPPDDPRSNYGAARADLLDHISAPAGNVLRMRGEHGAEAAAAEYERFLCDAFDVDLAQARREPPALDLVVAGIGNDGHTASLFPGTKSALRDDALCVAVTPGNGLEPRVTLSRPVLIRAHCILILAAGASKREVVQQARTAGDLDEVPARLYQQAAAGTVTWILDRAAAP